jgi:hypothetical protein
MESQVSKRLKRPQIQYPPIRKTGKNVTRSEQEKTESFVTHISKVFKPNSPEITLEVENKILSELLLLLLLLLPLGI